MRLNQFMIMMWYMDQLQTIRQVFKLGNYKMEALILK